MTLQSQRMTAGLAGRASGISATSIQVHDDRLPQLVLSSLLVCSGQTTHSTSSYRHLDTLGACHDYHISGYGRLHDTMSFSSCAVCSSKILFTREIRARSASCRFSLAQGLGPGVRLCSDYFEVAGQLWRLEVYPAGVSAEAAHHLSLFLTTPGSSVSASQVLHKIVIVDQVCCSESPTLYSTLWLNACMAC